MVLVLVLGVSASFAADSNQTDMQASDESAAIVNDTLTTSGLNEQTINKEDCLGTTNEESYSSSNDDILEAGEGSFTDLETEIRKGGTITLTKNYKYDSSKDSAYVNGIVVNETVTINGNGKTIDGSNLARTFYVTASNVVIKNLNFINGYSTGYGNNIRWTGNYGLLTDCTFKYSLSWTPNSLISGAVHFGGAYGVITNCLFDRNVANYTSSTPDGGGLSVHGTQNTVKNCNFTNNYARGSGGAIHQQGSYNTILDCYFYNNTCAEFGGAVLLWSTNHNVINCTFVSNKNIGGSTGGALATYYGTANVTGCDFRDNSAKVHGGAISITSSGSMVNVKDCNFTNNSAGSNGGALYLTLGYSTVVNCNFESNTAANGGASFVSGSMNTIEECEFKSNTATATGGAVYVSGDSSTITDSKFTSNSDTKGSGALYVASGKSTYLDDLTYTTSSDTVNTTGVTQLSNVLYVAPTAKGNKDGSNANNAANWTYAYSHIANGGTIYFTQGTYTNIVSQTISKSLNLIGLGTVTVDLQQNGRAFTISSPYTTVDNIDFKNGKITGSGGALYWSGAYGVLKNSNFEYNYASTDGGAVEWTGIYGTITDCTFNHNQADDVGWTGAAVMIASSYTKVLNSRFTYNTAPGDSGNNAGDGTLVLAGNYNIVDNCYFAHNSAANDGSALGTQSKHNIIKNSVFEHNYAIKTTSTKQRGTLNVLEGGSNITIDNCTFFNNTNVHGGAIYVLTSSGTDTTITGCIFIKNNATYGGAELFCEGSDENVFCLDTEDEMNQYYHDLLETWD